MCDLIASTDILE